MRGDIGYSTNIGDGSRPLLDFRERDGTRGSTAMSEEAVQPSLGRLGLGVGEGEGGNWLDEDLDDER